MKYPLRSMFLFLLLGGAAFAASVKKNPHEHGNDPVLPGGSYAATAAALPCGGCVSLVEETLNALPGIQGASVDIKTRRVDFSVKEGAQVKWSDIQTSLQAAAKKMGMGADYTLSEFQTASKKLLPPAEKKGAACCPSHK